MASNTLEITVGSATDLKDVNCFTTMDVYTVVQMEGGPFNSEQKQSTHVAKGCGPDPIWNHSMKFTVDEEALQQNRLFLKFEIKSERCLGDRDIGEVSVSIKKLLDQKAEQQIKNVSPRVRRPNGKPRGTFNFNYKFGDKFAALAEAEKPQAMGYPATAPGYMAAGGSSVCPAPPPQGHGGCPPQEVMKPPKKSGGPEK